MEKKNKETGMTSLQTDAELGIKLKPAKMYQDSAKVRMYANLLADTYALAVCENEENDSKYLHGVAVMLGEILQEKIEFEK